MLTIPELLSKDDLARVAEWIDQGRFVDGSHASRGVGPAQKRNLVFHLEGDPIEQLAVRALSQSAIFESYVLPSHFAPPMVNKYEAGMEYGEHLDAALMGQSPRMRCDMSVTIFLSEPSDYEGGELVASSPLGEVRVKLPAGWAVVYPSDTLHRIEPIRKGSRIVVVTWAQSFVRDGQIREMLFDLRRALERTQAAGAPHAAMSLLLKTHTNLFRKFAEP